ncbi:MAG TPA: dipeptidase [Thermoanaerobaculia bacterium]|nr:dipeptidase [Thermoanaerobaculia bacterium]
MHPIRVVAALFLIGCASSSSSATIQQSAAASADDALVARARAIHARAITIDTHVDIPDNFATPEADPLTRTAQVNLQKMKTGGLDVAFFAVFVGQGARTPEGDSTAKAAALRKFAGIHRMAEQLYPDRIEIAYTPADVERIVGRGKLVAAIGIENGWVIGHDLSLVKTYYDLGARYMTLAHTSNNDICDSSTDPRGPEHHGLSGFGRQVVEAMNRVGMMVDISHVSKECMMQATALSRSPVIASHSATRALADHPRDMDDEQLLALKQNGGVMQTVAFTGYVKVQPPERDSAVAQLRRELGIGGRGGRGGRGGGGGRGGIPDSVRATYEARMAEIDARWPPATVKDFVDHIDYAVKLIGIDHVGISSDFDGGGGIRGWNGADESLNVTTELVRRGYTEEQIRKLWGGNLLRVWAENQRRAIQGAGTD